MYSKIFKKAGAAVMAAAMALNGAVISASTAVAADPLVFEFEDAVISGDVTVESGNGASGGSYLKMTETGTIELTVNVDTAGAYNLIFWVGGIGGSKQQSLAVNGTSVGVLAIPESEEFASVTVPSVALNAGENIITITKSWGWSTFDYLEVKTFEYPEIKATQTTPVDQLATKETQSLMSYLSSVYGEHIISGQQEIYSGGPHGLETEFEYLKDLTGHYPAIRGFDYGNFCCPCYGSDDGSTTRIIDWVKNKNGIATASFHINVPKNMESYNIGDHIDWKQTTYAVKNDDGSEATNFVTSNAYKEGTKEYEYYRQSLETLAAEFNKLEAEGVPVIWRPLHEAEGGGGETGSWFWWGKEGSAVYKELWKYTYETLTNDFNCHNLIWEWNSYDFATSADWYPGDDYVDIIGYDKYSCTKYLAEYNWQAKVIHDESPYASTFYNIMERYDSAKMVAMAENDSFSTVEKLQDEKAGWLYFCTWYDGGSDDIDFLSNANFNTKEATVGMYQSEYCITLDELPADLYANGVDPDPALTTTKVTTTAVSTTATTTVTTEADPTKDWGSVKYNSKDNNYDITLPEPASEFYLSVEVPSDVTYANGGLGVTVELDGTYYWVNIQWEVEKSGDVLVNLEKNFLNCSIGTETVEDEDVIAAVQAALGERDSFQGQIWYASDASGKSASTSGVKLVGAYIKKSDVSEETTTVTTKGGSVEVSLLGDANVDGKVSLADAVAIIQSIGNADKYKLTEQGAVNADCFDPGSGVTSKDALSVQKYEAKAISSLPEFPAQKILNSF